MINLPERPPTEMDPIRPFPGSAPRARTDQQVRGDHWCITVLDAGLFRIEWSDDGEFEDRASTFALRRDLDPVPGHVERDDTGVVITTERARVHYDGHPFSSHGLLVECLGADGGQWRYGDVAGDLGGTTRTLDGVDGPIRLEPGVIARGGVAVIDDTDSFLFDDDGWIATRRPGRRDLYVFAYGRDFTAAISAFYAVSGMPTLLPRWALGNWWSRYHPYTADSYLALMDRFRAEALPFAVAVIDMDWHRVESVPPEFGTGWTGYSWDPALFPDPRGFLRALHERGLHAALNLHPADGVRAYEDAYPKMARAVGTDPGTGETVAFDPTDPEFLHAYFTSLHRPLEADGVDFWWIDWQQGRHSNMPGVDPLWLLNHFHHLDASRNGGPGMLFSRYAGPGSHRYAVGFSGDTIISWNSLAFQPEFTATASNIGYCWWSHDIGGHDHGICDDQLATRWLQFGVFSPILRMHSGANPFIRKEPWEFDAEHRSAMSESLRFRHRLVPYLHTMNHRAAAGTPLVRPMYHVEPRRPEAFDVPNQYAFGTELVVVPISEPNSPESLRGRARAWLPPGIWTDIFTGTVYHGDRSVELHRTTASIPVLLRNGGILPLAALTSLDASRNPSAIEVLVAPAAAGEFVLAEDDEDDLVPGVDGGPAARTTLRWDPAPSADPHTGEFRIGPATGRPGVVPAVREWTVTFLAQRPDGPVTVDGQPVAIKGVDGRWSVTTSAGSREAIVIRIAGGPLRRNNNHLETIRELLERAQIANQLKIAAWGIVNRSRPDAERIAELAALALPAAVHNAVIELLGAAGG
ncbi:glycoside hydrolase family 31 protein [Pseudonocardia sp. GCM10023141]|uniref:glycoside hydrolase family 31 protein n=1 Tax=Pseudonocardia sp. GCM10023141 TaxID=3252653 RepID=UPI0036D2C7A6